ncbi:hypothetical protein PR048_027076 [Dryococelus australis]|uniref:Uncharacterized protein n=1 Tax=Dryococelus australis TaxID=614101 RepID=A0ABQ9GG48_9NEOP|nr:hypothetical protein PR048_027076 [Dryococelus australis]
MEPPDNTIYSGKGIVCGLSKKKYFGVRMESFWKNTRGRNQHSATGSRIRILPFAIACSRHELASLRPIRFWNLPSQQGPGNHQSHTHSFFFRESSTWWWKESADMKLRLPLILVQRVTNDGLKEAMRPYSHDISSRGENRFRGHQRCCVAQRRF